MNRSPMVSGNPTKRSQLVEATLNKMASRLSEATGLAQGSPDAALAEFATAERSFHRLSSNSHLAAGLIDAIFPSTLGSYGSSTPIVRMGDVLVAGKQYMNTQNGLDGQASADTTAEEYLYHWFGDPTMPIWTHKPSLFVLEVNGGFCAAHKIAAGAKVQFEGVPR